MMKIFITGTDTDAGKTVASVGLLNRAAQQGWRTLGLKPVSAGCEWLEEEWQNDDALKIAEAMTESAPYNRVNPFAFEPPIAPHIAAERVGVQLTVDELCHSLRSSLAQDLDFTLVEGAGGALVPLNQQEFLLDICGPLNLSVVLVVGMKLGCLNHALLTLEAIRARGLPVVGWIANQVDPHMAEFDANLDTLKQHFCTQEKVPLLGVIPWLGEHTDNPGKQAATYLELPEITDSHGNLP